MQTITNLQQQFAVNAMAFTSAVIFEKRHRVRFILVLVFQRMREQVELTKIHETL